MKRKMLALLISLAMVCTITACGSKEQQVEEAEKMENVVETKKEKIPKKKTPTETVKEEPMVEETEIIDDAPVHPTSRTQFRSLRGVEPTEIPETIEYNADGGYTVTGTFIDEHSNESWDIITTYDSQGLITEYKDIMYNQDFHDGLTQIVEATYGYPLSSVYSGIDPETNEEINKADDYVADKKIALDNSGNIVFNTLDNLAFVDMGANTPGGYSESRRSIGSPFALGFDEDIPLSTKVETDGQKMYVSYIYAGEKYNLETRKNEETITYAAVDVFTFNSSNLIEAIEGYTFNDKNADDVDIYDLSSIEPDRYVYYTYDSQNNVTEIRGRVSFDMVITYDYGTDNSDDSTNVSAPTSSSDVTGNWRCTSGGYTYDAIYFDADGTGNLYHGIDAYPLKYSFDGKKITMHADVASGNGDFVFYVYLDENKIVEGESDAVYMRQ